MNNNQTYQPYTGNRVADFGSGWSPALDWFKSMVGASNPDLNQARNSLDSVGANLDPSKTTADYMNPYIQGVLAPTLQNIDQGYKADSAGLGADAAAAGAYGDARHGVQQALLAKNKNDAISNATASAYSNAFNNAQNQQNTVLGKIMNLAQGYGNIGNQQFTQDTTAANAAAGMGQAEQTAGQTGINSLLSDWNKGQTWGMDQLSKLAAILGGLPTNKTTTGTSTTRTPDNGGLALLGSILGSML